MMNDTDLATVLSLLDDEHVRSILTVTSERPMSATELGEHCGLSKTSIYRRLDRLRDADLVEEQTRPRSDGHHEAVYVSRLDRFELAVRNGSLSWEIDRQHVDVADQLTELWGRF
jgi:predicted transcriptional regulator